MAYAAGEISDHLGNLTDLIQARCVAKIQHYHVMGYKNTPCT